MNEFIGGYIRGYLRACVASALSGVNVLLVTKPGWGKTDVLIALAKVLAGSDKYQEVELSAGTNPSKLAGIFHPGALLKGELRMHLIGTPKEPGLRIAILDELSRTNDAVADEALHVAARKDIPARERPTVWGTSNWVEDRTRWEALMDRFGLVVWDRPTLTDKEWERLIEGQMEFGDPELPAEVVIPTWQEVETIRNLTPGPNAKKAVIRAIMDIRKEMGAAKGEWDFNPRRATQWSKVLFFYSAFLYGDPDFSEVHPEAFGLLRYAYPNRNYEEFLAWETIVKAGVDIVGSAIDEMFTQIVGELQKFEQASSTQDKDEVVAGIIAYQQQAINDLMALKTGDRKADKAINDAVAKVYDYCRVVIRGGSLKELE